MISGFSLRVVLNKSAPFVLMAAAGIRSVWVNRQGQAWQETDFRADYEVSDLHGPLELLT